MKIARFYKICMIASPGVFSVMCVFLCTFLYLFKCTVWKHLYLFQEMILTSWTQLMQAFPQWWATTFGFSVYVAKWLQYTNVLYMLICAEFKGKLFTNLGWIILKWIASKVLVSIELGFLCCYYMKTDYFCSYK